jgi:hypothetical protein
VHYEIRVNGVLGSSWSAWFDGLQVTSDDRGQTTIAGPVTDQAALHGLLAKIRDLGLPLLEAVTDVARAIRSREQLAGFLFERQRNAEVVFEEGALFVQRPGSQHRSQQVRRRIRHEAFGGGHRRQRPLVRRPGPR